MAKYRQLIVGLICGAGLMIVFYEGVSKLGRTSTSVPAESARFYPARNYSGPAPVLAQASVPMMTELAPRRSPETGVTNIVIHLHVEKAVANRLAEDGVTFRLENPLKPSATRPSEDDIVVE